MQVIDKLIVSDRALAVIKSEVARLRPKPSDILVLTYMSRFVNVDGTTVEGFAPGYTVEFEPGHQGGDIWTKARLPDGTELHFIPRFEPDPRQTYMLNVASGYTLSIELHKR